MALETWMPATSVGTTRGLSESPRPKDPDTELLLQRPPEPVLHLRPLIVRRRRALVFGLGLDAQADEIRPRRRDDLGDALLEIGEIVDGRDLANAGAFGD